MFESVDGWMHKRTDGRTDASSVPSYKLTLWAFGSGELMIKYGSIYIINKHNTCTWMQIYARAVIRAQPKQQFRAQKSPLIVEEKWT